MWWNCFQCCWASQHSSNRRMACGYLPLSRCQHPPAPTVCPNPLPCPPLPSSSTAARAPCQAASGKQRVWPPAPVLPSKSHMTLGLVTLKVSHDLGPSYQPSEGLQSFGTKRKGVEQRYNRGVIGSGKC